MDREDRILQAMQQAVDEIFQGWTKEKRNLFFEFFYETTEWLQSPNPEDPNTEATKQYRAYTHREDVAPYAHEFSLMAAKLLKTYAEEAK